ncbi:MAG: NAD(P)H-dependent oxidoreductase [Actinocatenispora sp.]
MSVETRILLVSGSTRERSTNTAALRTARDMAPPGVVAELYGGLSDLPAFSPDADDDRPHPAVAELRGLLTSAHAVLFCTPEYAGALPGSFKNLLDWTVGTGELYGKPAAWINAAAPGRGDLAHESLATVLRYVTVDLVADACVRIPVGREAVDERGEIADRDVRARIGAVVARVAEHAVAARA